MKRKLLITFLVILLLGSFLRIYDLGTESLWVDEAYTVDSIKQDSISGVLPKVEVNEFYTPPFYYILLHYWAKFTGYSEFSLRFFSAFFGILSIILLFLAAKEIFNPKVGLISSLIMSLSIMDILYSQEIRTYSFFSFLVLASMYFFIKILKEDRSIHYLLYVLFSIGMTYTLPFGFIILFLQNLFLFIFYSKFKKLIRRWVFGQASILFFFIPQIPNFIKMFKKNYLITFSYVGKYGAPEILRNTVFTSILFIIAFVILMVFILYFKERIKSYIENFKFKRYKYFFLSFLVILFLLYIYLIPILIRPIFLTRYSLFLMPFLYVFITAGTSKIEKPFNIIIISIIILLSIYALSIYYIETTKEDWRSASKYIEENFKLGEPILVCSTDLVIKYYYFRDNELINLKSYQRISDIEGKLKDNSYWVVFSPSHTRGKACEEVLSDKQHLIDKTFKGIEIYHLKWTQ